MREEALLHELTPTAEALLERHLDNAREWFPHEFVPWSQGRDFEPGEEWDPDEAPMDDAVRSALFVNLLTEDNLPHYFRTIRGMFDIDRPWGAWARRWTAEEGRHSDGIPDLLVYVTLQELATRISHTNTGRMVGDRRGREVMARVAGDEQLHHVFYRDLTSAALEVDPSGMVLAIEKQVRGFEMPGTGIPDFGAHAKAIANAGIYDFASHSEHILEPVVRRHWGLDGLEGLSPEAEDARARVLRHMGKVAKVGRRMAARRAERQDVLAATG